MELLQCQRPRGLLLRHTTRHAITGRHKGVSGRHSADLGHCANAVSTHLVVTAVVGTQIVPTGWVDGQHERRPACGALAGTRLTHNGVASTMRLHVARRGPEAARLRTVVLLNSSRCAAAATPIVKFPSLASRNVCASPSLVPSRDCRYRLTTSLMRCSMMPDPRFGTTGARVSHATLGQPPLHLRLTHPCTA